jgi:phage repressor protein C with HTH and peptisase S24 domain
MRQARKRQRYSDEDYGPAVSNPGKSRRKVVDLRRASRLRQTRIAAGFTRAVDASRAFGWKATTYHSHENGQRGISRDRILIYASAFHVRPDWLAFGNGMAGAAVERRIPIAGYMTSQAKIITTIQEDRETGRITETATPPGVPGDWVAYRVEGDGNYPAYQDGDVLFVQRRPGPPADHINRECLVTMPDGDYFVRRILRGTRVGLFVLIGFNNPPMIDVEITAAAPIEWIKRG